MSTRPELPITPSLIPKEKQTEETLMQMFSERVSKDKLDAHSEARLREYFGYLREQRPEDWFDWGAKAILQVATKTTTAQRTLPYLIGLYKSWLTNGFGTYVNAELFKLYKIFEERHGTYPSEISKTRLSKMVQDYGLTYVTSAVLQAEDTKFDRSLIVTNEVERYIKENYSRIEVN